MNQLGRNFEDLSSKIVFLAGTAQKLSFWDYCGIWKFGISCIINRANEITVELCYSPVSDGKLEIGKQYFVYWALLHSGDLGFSSPELLKSSVGDFCTTSLGLSYGNWMQQSVLRIRCFTPPGMLNSYAPDYLNRKNNEWSKWRIFQYRHQKEFHTYIYGRFQFSW